jgi:TRAP-type C4-dicarboxylate transport system permease small subunit
LAVSFSQRRWEHLAMGIVFDRLSPRARRPILGVLLSLGIFICVMLTWSSFNQTVWAYGTGDTIVGAIPVKTWWSRMAIPIGISVATVRLTVQLIQVVRGEV